MAENVAELIAEIARTQPDRPAIIHGGRTTTFAELDKECNLVAAGLKAAGIEGRAAMFVPPSPELVALTFGMFRAGITAVFIDPGIGFKNMGNCIEQARPQAFIGVPKAQLARIIGRWGTGAIKKTLTVGPTVPGGLSYAKIRRMGENNPGFKPRTAEPAAILFTSGSTGAPKGAVYSHSIFLNQAKMLRDYFGIKPGGCSIPTFPLFALFDVALGMTAVIPDMDFTRPADVNPAEIIRLAEKYGAEQLFGSPALLHTVSSYAQERGLKMPSLRRVISAGAPVHIKILRRCADMLPPDCLVHTPYGATEALPVSCIASDEILSTAALSAQGKGTCVGRPFAGMEVKIIKISDEPIENWSDSLLAAPGEIGEIVVKGPVATLEYFSLPGATMQAKIPCADGTFYHRMGDAGYIDPEGRIWFCGRKNHRLETPAGVMFTVPCEAVFNTHAKVRRTALVGVGMPPNQLPILCVELEKGETPSQELKRELLELGAKFTHTKVIHAVLFHKSFPVDIRHNAKIFREKLAQWSAERI